MASRKWSCLLIALLLLTALAGVAVAPSAASEPGSIESFQVKFKLDAATTKSLYMGDVWAGPAQFTAAHAGRLFTVEAKAVGLEAGVNEVDIAATWQSADPSLVQVSPGTGKQVKFTVLKAGQGTVQVSFGNLTKKLAVKASYAAGVMNVEIDQ